MRVEVVSSILGPAAAVARRPCCPSLASLAEDGVAAAVVAAGAGSATGFGWVIPGASKTENLAVG